MATYNGARYVEHQVRTILADLHDADELVVVDDASTDDTVAIVDALHDPRIRILRQDINRGYVRSFEIALMAVRNDIVLLSDQDDEWIPGRRDLLAGAAADAGVAASNLILLGSEAPLSSPITGRPWRLRAATSHQRVRNEMRILVGNAPYFGCAMALRRDVLELALPFPAFLTESHDLWIATVANAAGRMRHVEPATLRRRLHDANASSRAPRGVRAAIASRLLLLRAWREARRRLRAA
jgi:glycosyltransferase involved in cell wall biosynthesis